MQEEIKQAVDGLMTAFEEFKSTNDARLVEIEKKGGADPLVNEKLGRIETTLAGFEGLNQRLTQAEAKAKALAEHQEQADALLEKMELKLGRPGAGGTRPGEMKAKVNLWGRAVYDAFVLGVPNLPAEEQKALQDATAEYKALNVGTDAAGGYLAPVEFVQEIIKGVTELSPVRSLARVRQTGSKSITIPKRTGQFAAIWTAEQGQRSESNGLGYGTEDIPVHELYAIVDISSQMLEDSAFDMAAELQLEASEQFAVAEGAAYVAGSGVGKPQGFLAASGVGTTNSGSATTIADADGQANGLLTLKHAIKSAYARNANWLMNRTTLGSVRKLKDGEKNYLWMPGIAQGKPNTIDGDPYVEMPDMPNEGAGLKPIAYGDFHRGTTWVDRISMEMLRDPFTQATGGNVRFLFRKRTGGQVVLAEAIRTLTCAAA